MQGRLFSTVFMNHFLCNLKGCAIISFGMLLMCSGNDCPTAPRLFAQHYSWAWKPAIHHHPYSAQQRLLTRKPPLLKKQRDYPQLVIRVRRCITRTPDFTYKLTLWNSISFEYFSYSVSEIGLISVKKSFFSLTVYQRWNKYLDLTLK